MTGPAEQRVYLTQSAARTSRRTARYHWPAARRRFGPPPGTACGDLRIATETARAPADIPIDRRCGGRGCRDRWATIDHPDDLLTAATENP